ncbi:MFS transporter [Gordonia sp. CPCC 205333]|uniref:MFS transporter n=1 Tax=Gordonia sp. CPCC 205333 TaxID=3140790 RepID=UPI003AF39A18
MPRLHYAWIVFGAAFVTLLAAAAFRSAPGVMMTPLHHEFGWSHGVIGLAMSINMLLFGLISPFAAALMDRWGVRPVVGTALVLIAAGTAMSTTMTASWQLVLLWGVFVGAGAGCLSTAFVATVATRWFVARRGLVTGILTAASATGQLIFLPLVAAVTTAHGWRVSSLLITAATVVVIPIAIAGLRNWPSDVNTPPFGASEVDPSERDGGVPDALAGLRLGIKSRVFWLLAISFAICGATTNGLLQTHFIPAAGDHGMPATTAASLLAVVGIFDVGGTVISGWLTDRYDPRILLVVYYIGRGASLAILPALLSPHATAGTAVFIIFYGLDWVATVPPTIALCRDVFGNSTPIVFGWIFAFHQVGAAIAAFGAGVLRDLTGTYTSTFIAAATLCVVAAVLCGAIPRRGQVRVPELMS